jgi:hypothetical protein
MSRVVNSLLTFFRDMQLCGGGLGTLGKILMAYVVVNDDGRALDDEIWLREARSGFDVGATLKSALEPLWTVDREFDPSGDLSVIVMPVSDTATHPSFVLYEENAVVRVSTFLGDDWRNRQTFRSCQRAVDAIIEAASLVYPPACQASGSSHTIQANSSVQ